MQKTEIPPEKELQGGEVTMNARWVQYTANERIAVPSEFVWEDIAYIWDEYTASAN